MKYFYDTEFLEGTQKKLFGKTVPTIDLISIGIICEDGREYYTVSKDFNLKEAWNRYDLKHEETSGDMRNHFPNGKTTKVYWIRENVLRPIWDEYVKEYNGNIVRLGLPLALKNKEDFSFRGFQNMLTSYGKTNKQIAKEIKNFCYSDKETIDKGGQIVSGSFIPNEYPEIKLYSYYSAYDHVALCWLFGKMVDLPKCFPMYTIDLKQELDEKIEELISFIAYSSGNHTIWSKEEALKYIKSDTNYPKEVNSHHALADAKWIFELCKFLNKWQ